MLSRAQNTFHHNPRLRGPVSSIYIYIYIYLRRSSLYNTVDVYTAIITREYSTAIF